MNLDEKNRININIEEFGTHIRKNIYKALIMCCLWLSIVSTLVDFFKGACKGLQISEYWHMIPLLLIIVLTIIFLERMRVQK